LLLLLLLLLAADFSREMRIELREDRERFACGSSSSSSASPSTKEH